MTAITDSTGSVIQRYEYDSFGNIVSMLDPNFKQPYTYTSREYDEETGLYFYRTRYYDPKVGRFISEDPIGFAGGIDLFTYVGNNPVNKIDPMGLYDCTYSVGQHKMVCIPNNPANPNFSSNQIVSGKDGNANCQNNSSCQDRPDTGPIPQGSYTVGSQLPNSSRRNLIPDPNNNMYGRSGFQFHGCGNPATCSTGCIAATTNKTRDDFNRLMSLEPNSIIRVVP